MNVPQSMRKQFLDRFEKLVTDGTQIRDSVKPVYGEPTARAITPLVGYEVSDPQRFSKWKTNLKVEAEVAADYMGQAEGLLKEGQPGKFDYVPAGVLAGALLEKALRTLCDEQQPPVSIVNAKGELRTLNSLIDELKKAEVFNELKAKQLRSWADIRNAAAHGPFSDFGKADVAQMISGINNFLADYLK